METYSQTSGIARKKSVNLSVLYVEPFLYQLQQ